MRIAQVLSIVVVACVGGNTALAIETELPDSFDLVRLTSYVEANDDAVMTVSHNDICEQMQANWYLNYDQLFLNFNKTGGVGVPAFGLRGEYDFEPALRLSLGTNIGDRFYSECRWLSYNGRGSITNAPGSLGAQLNSFDLVGGYGCCFGNGIAARLEGGVRYYDIYDAVSTQFLVGRNASHGLGLLIGGQTSKALGPNLSLYTRANLATLTGDGARFSTFVPVGPGSSVSNTAVTALDYGAGIGHNRDLGNGWQLNCQLGAEVTTYYGAGKDFSVSNPVLTDISLTGFGFRLGIAH
ncbi:MAG: hypothetical protein KDB14_30035 [Planctomycetales bacterium]|nr:hypothetical protein [Planctomycetales bacterium]